MLTLLAGQPECLWDEALPIEVRELPEDLAELDRVLADPELMWPLVERWRQESRDRPVGVDRGAADDRDGDLHAVDGAQAAYRWGYRTLVAEVSDSIHLRRFCRIALSERVPDESTVRKLTRRIGPETVNELTRALIVKATRAKRFRPRAVRIDSTVIEADVKYPTDAGLAAQRRRACSPGRVASLRSWSGRRSGGCGIARGRWVASCARSRARFGVARGRPSRGAAS